ncbi:unnamed protein product [Paramecium primaurelia]|uniref:Uncharacterized protein n=1 Tax=Paramecium primaurelia TaxID=5886 RepID=A0A8S1L1F9_PARPR|nr:unnamed protein product [Paramecium primaurelia]
MQQLDLPFVRKQKQNTDIWKGPSFKDYSFEEERTSHIYKKQHRRKSCYCQLCGKMSLFQYTYMNVSSCVNHINKSLILQQDIEKQQELEKQKHITNHRLFRDYINQQNNNRSKSIDQINTNFINNYLRDRNRKSCECNECGIQSTFQQKYQNLHLFKKQILANQFRIKKILKRPQFRKQNTEQFSPVKNGEFRYLKKRILEIDLNNSKNENPLLKKFQVKQPQTQRVLRHQQSLNLFETNTKTKYDVHSPLENKKQILPYLQFNQNRSPPQKNTKKSIITNQQKEYFKKHNQKSGIF